MSLEFNVIKRLMADKLAACGCKVVTKGDQRDSYQEVFLCTIHKAAPELVNVLLALLFDPEYKISEEADYEAYSLILRTLQNKVLIDERD